LTLVNPRGAPLETAAAMRPEYRFDPDPWPFPQSISQPLNHAADCAHPTYM
jgi:hypothetical protein